jgi:hypothetical protein
MDLAIGSPPFANRERSDHISFDQVCQQPTAPASPAWETFFMIRATYALPQVSLPDHGEWR